MSEPRPARPIDVPTVLVGLGRFGGAVARRLVDERGEALRLVGADPEADDLRHVFSDLSEDPGTIADRVLAAVRAVLQHRRVVHARDLTDDEGLTRLHVLVFADLGEAPVRAGLLAALQAIERALLGRLAPIFESYRTGAARGAAIVPLLTMPHPPAHPEGPAIAAAVRGLLAAAREAPPEARALGQIYLLEDVAERSILAEGELAQCLRNFAALLLHGGDLELVPRLVHPDDPREPLATFVCATAELPRARLAAYAAHRIALEALAAVRGAPRVDTDLADLDALEEVEAQTVTEIGDADKDVLAVLERYAPRPAREPTPPWWEEGSALAARLGPDPGDASVDDPAPPADPPQGWVQGRMREIQETWRLLQRRRFDDVVARDRAAIEAWQARLRRRLRDRVDDALFADPSPAAFRHAEELVQKLGRAFGDQLERAIAERDAITPAAAPRFDDLRAAHAAALDAARRKPEVAVMALWGGLALLAALLFVAPLLRLAAATLMVERGALAFLLRDHAGLTALLLGLIVVGAICGRALFSAQIAIQRALDELAAAQERTVFGPRGSLFDYFASRLRLSRAIARVEVLLSIRGDLDADGERLLLADKAARRAQVDLREAQRQLGVRDDDGHDDLTGLLGRPDEALIESLVGPRGAAEIADALDPAGAEARTRDVLATLADHYRHAGRWREEIPFADLARLRRAAARHAGPIAAWDPFADARRAEATADHLAAFLRRQWRTLRGALNFSGHEERDATGVRRLLHGEALLPPGGHQLIAARLQDDRTPVPARRGGEADRAYYLLVAAGIHEDAVASLGLPAPKDLTPGTASPSPAGRSAPASPRDLTPGTSLSPSPATTRGAPAPSTDLPPGAPPPSPRSPQNDLTIDLAPGTSISTPPHRSDQHAIPIDLPPGTSSSTTTGRSAPASPHDLAPGTATTTFTPPPRKEGP